MKFTHHPTKSDWVFDADRTYPSATNRDIDWPWAKPKGLWLSVDGDWQRWWEDNDFGTFEHDSVEFDLDVNKCLHLSTVEEMDTFDRTYVVGAAARDETRVRFGLDADRIDWAPLAEEFPGIIIAPYQWERRFDGAAITWYYSWDCASACIWDLSVLRVRSGVSS